MAEQQISLNVSPEVAQGVYSNFAIISHSSSEFIIDFAVRMPGIKDTQVRSRIILAPEHAKRLLFALQDNLAKYENQFGMIQLDGQSAKGSAVPMSFGGGEA